MKQWILLAVLLTVAWVSSSTAAPILVKAIGGDGWMSDDTRDAAGIDLVGLNYTHYGRPGQTPTATDDIAIANQIHFVFGGPDLVSALKLYKTTTGGYSKSTLSKVDEAGFATGDWRGGFFARMRYYADSTAEMAALKIGVQSAQWAASQAAFTAIRSGEPIWDLVLVDWRGTNPPWTIGSWADLATDASTACWKLYRQSGNLFFNPPPSDVQSLDAWAADTRVACTVGGIDYTWAEVLFGATSKAVSVQLGVGSSTQTSTTWIDYLETSLVNGGDRVEFGVPPNVVCAPDPLSLNVATPGGTVVAQYLGGGSGLVYGYSVDVLWDPAVVTGVVGLPDNGPFHTAVLFHLSDIASGGLVGKRVDAALGGTTPGIASGELFKIGFTAVGAAPYATSPVDLTLIKFRDLDNLTLTGFWPDDGMVVVDRVAPAVSGVFIENITLAHTDDYVKNTDQVQVIATVTDGHPDFGAGNIVADLSPLGGGAAAAPTSYDGVTGAAVWGPFAANTGSGAADGLKTVGVTATDPLLNFGSGNDGITADNTKPASLLGLTAAPGNQKVTLAWTDAAGNDANFYGVTIRFKRWTGYPVYAPTEPAYPDGPAAGDGAAYDGIGSSHVHARPYATQRDIYCYGGLVYDWALNYSDPGSGSTARATCYWLGDVCGSSVGDTLYDGSIGVGDITTLGSAYGLPAPIAAGYDECDVGPTHNGSRLGIPLTDGSVDFEDLMIFAMNYGVITPKAPPAATAAPLLAWSRQDERTWTLTLESACPRLQGLNVRAQLPEGTVAQVAPGALLQGLPLFVKNVARDGLNAALAVLGTNAGIAGTGELLRVILPADVTPGPLTITARGVDNEPLLGSLTQPTEVSVPRTFALSQNVPNPFNPSTRISFALPQRERVRLAVYALDGRRVRLLVDEDMVAGAHEVAWNGRDDRGQMVASGTYVYRIEAGTFTRSHKMVLMK